MTPATDTALSSPVRSPDFRLAAEAEPLPGGRGRSVRVGDAVLKPAADSADAEWSAGLVLLRALVFRVAAPGVLAGPDGTPPEAALARFARVADLVGERIGGQRSGR